jgi:CBS domain containing-hemolysin-like protein
MSTEQNGRQETATASVGEERAQTLSGWLSALRSRLGMQDPQTLRDTLEDALKGDADAAISSFSNEEREMLLRMLRFSALRVDDVMVPRADIIAIEENASIGDLIDLLREAGVSRIPLYNDTLDDPRGMVHIKDFFTWLMSEGATTAKPSEAGNGTVSDLRQLNLAKIDLSRPITVTKVRRPTLYVPPSMPAMNLLIRMQSTRNHMAIVVDEYGGTDGLITIEDLVEQIVGAIEDEHDEADAEHISDDPKLGMLAAARTPIEELEARIGIKLLNADEEEDIDTLGGLVFAIVGRVPARGEVVRHHTGVEFEVLDADPRRVKKLKVVVPAPPADETPTGLA